MNGPNICFNRSDLNLYIFILFCLIVYLIYIALKSKDTMTNINLNRGLSHKELENKITSLNKELYNCTVEKQMCNRNLQQLSNNNSTNIQQKFLNKIYNPLAPPENVYGGGRLNQKGYDRSRLAIKLIRLQHLAAKKLAVAGLIHQGTRGLAR